MNNNDGGRTGADLLVRADLDGQIEALGERGYGISAPEVSDQLVVAQSAHEADATVLEASESTRVRRRDFCFTPAHSQSHGGSIRRSNASRHQWLTRGFSTWRAQLRSSGSGRCIACCLACIEVTAVLRALMAEAATAEGGTV